MRKTIVFLILLLSLSVRQQAQNTPTMGWSSWNTYHVNISDSLIMRQADAMSEKGLAKAGYRYVNIDDGYFGGRDHKTGRLLIHPTRFPGGLEPVVRHIHGLGLKAGIYSDAGRNTCGSIYDADTIGVGVGMYGHDEQDCGMFFNELGFDFIKVDYCGGRPHPRGDTLNLNEQTRYTEIAEAIRRTGRKDVRLNVCRWDFPGTWVSKVAASWRISQDIRPRWSSVKDIIRQNLYLSAYAANGHFNDMDMLEVGRGMTAVEDNTHFAMWCIMASPLLIGCDLTTIKDETLRLLTNRELIAVNQDRLGLQAYVAKRWGDCYLLVKDIKQLQGKERAFAVVNLSDGEKDVTVDFRDIDMAGNILLHDLLDNATTSTKQPTLRLTIPAHGTRIFTAKAQQRLQRERYEAETAWLTAYQELSNNQAALTAVYEEDCSCSGGVKVSWLGGRSDNDLIWRNVYVKKSGRYALRIAAKTKASRTLHVSVNGQEKAVLTYTADGEQTVFADLRQGYNEIRLWNDNERMPDVDYMQVGNNGAAFDKLTVEGRVQPQGIDEPTPRFGWQIMADENDVRQTAYRLTVASAADADGDVWDSGIVRSDSSQWVSYKGPALQPNKVYYWRVRVTTNRDETIESAVSKWSTGLLDDGNWQGQWIGLDSLMEGDRQTRNSRLRVRYLRKDFQLENTAPVARATVHVAGLGLYALSLNGRSVSDDMLTPPPTDYTKSVIYQTYDVTELLSNRKSSGEALEVMLAPGYYYAMAQNYQANVRTTYGFPKLRLNLVVEYADGSSQTVATDTTWQISANGHIRYANIYDGECFDARQKPTDWMAARQVAAPGGVLVGNLTPPMTVYQRERPQSVRRIGDRWLIDFGTNNTGRVEYMLKGNEGDTIRFRYAEMLTGDTQRPTLYTENLRSAEQTDYYISDGQTRSWSTLFVWHGFRYVEVSGISDLDTTQIERQLIADQMDDRHTTLRVDADDDMLTRILANARRGIRSNYKGMPVDCPQRDERMPWLGDRTTGCLGESYMMNNHALYAKWVKDICESQRADGALSDVAPAYWRLYNGNVTWPAALPFACDMLYRQYGDLRPMQQCYENIVRWLRHVRAKSWKDGLITYDRYGDWCVPPESPEIINSKDPGRNTDGRLLASTYYYYICQMMARYADPVGRGSMKDYFEREAAMTLRAVNDTFLVNGEYANGTVTANLLPLAMGMAPASDTETLQRNLIQTITVKNDGHISAGIIGIQWLMRYLSQTGHGDVAWQLATQAGYPGWGYMVSRGATTIWELWNGDTANPAMNSGNHVMLLGDLVPWAYECLGGISSDPSQPGFRHVVMRPDFTVPDIRGVLAEHPSPYGVIRSHWQRTAKGIQWEIDLPVGTTATMYLPNGDSRHLSSGHHSETIRKASLRLQKE